MTLLFRHCAYAADLVIASATAAGLYVSANALVMIIALLGLLTPLWVAAQDDDFAGAIVDGQIVNTAPSWVVSGVVNGWPLCSATLIYPQWVISAGHCGALDGVRIGGNSHFNGTYVDVQQSFILESSGGNQDLALHRLSESVSGQPMELNRDTDLLSRTPWVTAMGYGARIKTGRTTAFCAPLAG